MNSSNNPATANNIEATLSSYARAWENGDYQTTFSFYHDDVIFHYFGDNPLTGSHRGKTACGEVLKRFSEKTQRQLVQIEDILIGEHYGIIIAHESLTENNVPVTIKRVFQYRVHENKIIECWAYDGAQAMIDRLLK